MKFSYSLLKKIIPALPSKEKVVDTLSRYAFEAESGKGDTIEVSVPPNRFSDASSHIGIARELSAILRLKFPQERQLLKMLSPGALRAYFGVRKRSISICIRTKDCARYTAAYFTGVRVKSSPAWIVRALRSCGIRPVSNIVDIMNYVMLQTGQPLHAFDADKIEDKKIVVRSAKKGEAMVALSGDRIVFDGSEILIADSRGPLGLAGIKGGKRAGVGANTTNIVVEAANFDGTSIYRASRRLGLLTDAAQRFSRRISPALTQIAILYASSLLKEIAGAQEKEITDIYPSCRPRRTILLDADKISAIVGHRFTKNEAAGILRRLGFLVDGKSRIIISELREDIETIEDVAEEVSRIFGYDRIVALPPGVHIAPPEREERVSLKDLMRSTLKGFGYDEVYTSSFISRAEGERYGDKHLLLAPSNPFSGDYFYLRPSLKVNLLKSAKENMKFLDEFRIFEIGSVFQKSARGVEETQLLGTAVASSKNDTFFDVKGELSALVCALGATGVELVDNGGGLFDIISGKETIGSFQRVQEKRSIVNVVELRLDALLKITKSERKFLPLPKYPAIMRDISVAGNRGIRVGDLMRKIQNADARVTDVYVVDEYGENITLRIVFQSDKRTLTDEEINETMTIISSRIKSDFGLRIR